MLALPERGLARSINEHNVRLDTFCDWIEGSVLFADQELSTTNVVDALTEELIYEEQDFAREIIASAWSELKRRHSGLGSSTPFSITTPRITRERAWQDVPAHSFCLLLSITKWYKDWASQFGPDYTEQGELFELLTKESLELQLAGWLIHQTGWSRTRAVKLAEVVNDVADRLGESKGDLERWAEPQANEAGLDLLCYRPFPDNRVGVPVYLLQCASGGDWKEKLKTPDLDLWTKIIEFAAQPQRAFATPFAFLDEEFIRNCNRVKGMLLDRYRLLAAGSVKEDWVSQILKDRIIDWATPRISKLPRRDI